MKLTGAQIVWESLVREGVEVVFGISGGAVIHLYHALPDYPIHHVLMRHEQAAAHAADGYARATGKVGVCIATSGPGATNLVTGLATAYMDSSPVVAITGQVPTSLIGKDAFQEVDITGITLPITKHNYLVTEIKALPMVIKEAFHIARTGRPGPVLIDIAKDVQAASLEYEYPEEVNLPGYRPTLTGNQRQIKQAAQLINQAECPIIIAGHGVILAGAEAELRELVEKAQIPVVNTLLGISSIPETHPLCLGMGGMHGEVYANKALQEADLVVALGSRFDDRLTGSVNTFAPQAKIIHVDIDPAEIGKNIRVDVPVVGDLKNILQALLPLIEPTNHSDWLNKIEAWRAESYQHDVLNQETDALLPQYIIRQIWHATKGEVIMVSDVGQNQMWEAQYFLHHKPRGLISSGGLGTMGFALPAAIGVQMGKPEELVWVTAGDGGFQMNIQELATVVQEKLPIKMAILNNGFLGMVRQWQQLFFEGRYSGTPLLGPDFAKVAEAYGIPGFTVREKSQVVPVIEQVMAIDGPALIDFIIEQEENVYPMVPPGGSIADMLQRPNTSCKVQSSNSKKEGIQNEAHDSRFGGG
jgi:acetolactate synthase-1/2/3 large subunit